MKFVSLFSGIEACSEAWIPLGWSPLAFAEIDPFACAVLAHRHGASRPARMPDPSAPGLTDEESRERAAAIRAVAGLPELARVPNVGDIRQHDWSEYRGRADILVGGPPCQAFSVAGLRHSLSDARGNLSLEYVRAIHAVDPLWTVTENVPGWLSTRDNAFGCFLAALVGEDAALVPTGGRWTDAGVVAGPERTAAWRILDAQFFGVAQRRRRVFVLSVRGSGDWRCAEALFPLGEGVPRNPPSRRKAGEGPAGTLAARTRGGGGLGTDFDLAGGVTVSKTLSAARGAAAANADDLETYVLAHAPKGEGFDASEDGTGRGVPLVAMLAKAVMPGDGQRNDPETETLIPVCSDARQSDVLVYGDQAGPLDTDGHTLAFMTRGPNVSVGGDVAGTLGTRSDDPGVSAPMVMTLATGAFGRAAAVRRLTPRECERLMAQPEDATLVPYRGKPAQDGPRYRSLGNSMVVHVMAWIGKRIDAVMKER